MSHASAIAPQPAAETELILIRHGVTAWNRERRFQGQIDIELDDEGHRQAARTAHRLRGEPVSAIYSSDLGRAWQTAMPIGQVLGLAIEREPGLRERRYGSFEGRTHDELQQVHADAYRRWAAREPDFELPGGGESLAGFAVRVEAVLHRLVRRHPRQRIVAVTHGGVLDCAYRMATGEGAHAPRHHAMLNASLNRLGFDGERFVLRVWADVAHLDEALDESTVAPGRNDRGSAPAGDTGR